MPFFFKDQSKSGVHFFNKFIHNIFVLIMLIRYIVESLQILPSIRVEN